MSDEDIESWKRMKVTGTIYLNDEDWDNFQKALNSPPAANERLRRLLNEPTICDGDET